MKFSLIFVLLCLPTLPAQAIEKCKTADGRTLYTDTHCPPGAKRVGALNADPLPSDAVQAQAQAERERLTQALDKAERAQAEREAADAKARAQAREAARQAEQQDLLRRQAEALERLAQERANAPVIFVPVVPPRQIHPPVKPRPQKKPDDDQDGVRRDQAPMQIRR